MDQLTHNVRRANWLNIINQCQERPANVTVRQWLKDNDIKEKSYYYWLCKFRKESYDQMQLCRRRRCPGLNVTPKRWVHLKGCAVEEQCAEAEAVSRGTVDTAQERMPV